MQLCFFDDNICSRFKPLTLTRPVDDLRAGILTLREKWQHELNATACTRVANHELQPLFSHLKLDDSAPSLFINSRFLPSSSLVEQVKNIGEGTCIKFGQTVVAARVDAETTQAWKQSGKPDFSSLLMLEGQNFTALENLWDLFLMNDDEIINDLRRLNYPSTKNNSVSERAILENPDQIYIGENAVIEPGSIIMADHGPVFIGDGTTVMAGAIIKGPTALCEDATVKAGAKIYHGTTIGPVCKVGGEISSSIFHSYSNKGHDGFLGNSLIGQWCNFGADTNTSNLKNNYSTIRITDWQTRRDVETGQQFLGTVMGDHTKTAINTQLNTGTVCGVSCNIFSDDFPPKFIPSFSWVGSNVIQPYKIDKALETMQAVMARRDVELTAEYEALMRHIFAQRHG